MKGIIEYIPLDERGKRIHLRHIERYGEGKGKEEAAARRDSKVSRVEKGLARRKAEAMSTMPEAMLQRWSGRIRFDILRIFFGVLSSSQTFRSSSLLPHTSFFIRDLADRTGYTSANISIRRTSESRTTVSEGSPIVALFRFTTL